VSLRERTIRVRSPPFGTAHAVYLPYEEEFRSLEVIENTGAPLGTRTHVFAVKGEVHSMALETQQRLVMEFALETASRRGEVGP
jgi:hypothetical protein